MLTTALALCVRSCERVFARIFTLDRSRRGISAIRRRARARRNAMRLSAMQPLTLCVYRLNVSTRSAMFHTSSVLPRGHWCSHHSRDLGARGFRETPGFNFNISGWFRSRSFLSVSFGRRNVRSNVSK